MASGGSKSSKQTLRAAVLGAGSWGTTVASIVSRNVPTIIWARDQDTADEINTKHTNSRYLADLKLSRSLEATSDMEQALKDADLVIMGVPSKAMRQTLTDAKPFIRPWVPIISLAKGFEPATRLRMTEVIKEIMPGHPPGVLSGPNLAREIIQGYAAASVLAMEDEVIVKRLQPIFESNMFRVYSNTDVTGCELGGALKNVIAIAAGMGDGAGAGENTRSAVVTRGLAEITRLGCAMGGRPETFAGLAGMGDLMATCTSTLSRNHSVGEALGRGKTIQQIIDDMNQVAEGVNSSKIVMDLAEDYEVEMPIAREVYRVCHEGSTARQAFRGLLRAGHSSELDPG
ncbi:MAG: NAD(P)H-dependent glycerol-3-phosphate dehydrogenase [Pseudomonadota bacterium]